MSNKTIKVLQVLGSLRLGGAESRVMDIYRNINKDLVDFDFLIFCNEEQPFEKEINSKIFKCIAPSSSNLTYVLNYLIKKMKEGQYDVVHAHVSYFCGVIMLAARIAQIPIRISHARTTGSVNNNGKKRFEILIGKKLISIFSTNRLAISKDAGEYLFGNSHFEILPNAIETERYQCIKNSTLNRLRKNYEIPDNSFVIGQIGRFDPMKNHKFTIQWFNDYHKSHDDAILVMVGDGNLRKQIEEEAEHLGIAEFVRFTGAIFNVNELINVFNVLIFPSIYEGLGGVVLEAQAAGKPIVMTDTLPIETDMGLGLITRCSLNGGFDEWTKAIDKCRKRHFVSNEIINDAFNRHKYSLEYEIGRLYAIYENG